MESNQIIRLARIMMMLVEYQILAPQTAPPKPTRATQTKSSATAAVAPAPRQLDSVAAKAIYGDFASAAIGTAKDIVVETDDVRLTFSTKGGNVKEVLLKKFKTYTNAPLYLIDEQSSKSVSYTHLDVYKRQDKDFSPNDRANSLIKVPVRASTL